MAVDIQLTPTQCKRARALLRWNPQDLASHTHIHVRHIEKFERNQGKLQRPENEELVKLFTEHHVVFEKNGEVSLKQPKSSGHSEEQRIEEIHPIAIAGESHAYEQDSDQHDVERRAIKQKAAH